MRGKTQASAPAERITVSAVVAYGLIGDGS